MTPDQYKYYISFMQQRLGRLKQYMFRLPADSREYYLARKAYNKVFQELRMVSEPIQGAGTIHDFLTREDKTC